MDSNWLAIHFLSSEQNCIWWTTIRIHSTSSESAAMETKRSANFIEAEKVLLTELVEKKLFCKFQI
jgi:hypothetical protein